MLELALCYTYYSAASELNHGSTLMYHHRFIQLRKVTDEMSQIRVLRVKIDT